MINSIEVIYTSSYAIGEKSTTNEQINLLAEAGFVGRVRELELVLIQEALKRTSDNRAKAAELLGITRQGLYKKLKRFAEETVAIS